MCEKHIIKKNNPIDNVPEEVLDKKIQEWQPFHK